MRFHSKHVYIKEVVIFLKIISCLLVLRKFGNGKMVGRIETRKANELTPTVKQLSKSEDGVKYKDRWEKFKQTEIFH